MKTRLLLSISLVFFLVSFSYAEFSGLPDQLKTNLAAIQKYPKTSSVLLWMQEKYQLQANGTQVYETHSFRYLPDDAARDAWGDPHVAYIDEEQKLEILASRCYTKDGRKVDSTPQNSFNPITPEELQFAPQLTKFRQMVITMLGLENGCIVELHYRLTTEKPLYRWLSGHVTFRETAPTIAHELIVELPAGHKLNYKSAAGAPEPKISGTVYTWTSGERAGYLTEDLGGNSELLPHVAFTTASDWSEVQFELKNRVQKVSQGDLAIPASLTEALAAKNDPEGKLDAVKSWCKERFNEREFHHADFPISLRSASAVLNSGYGNSLELAVMVSKLCNQMGLTTSVMLRYEGEAAVPYLQHIAGAVIEVRTPDNYFICDPILPRNELSQADLVGNTLMPINGDGKVSVMPSLGTASNSIKLFLSLENLDKDTLQGTGVFSAHGQLAPYEAVRSEGATAFLDGLLKLKGIKISEATARELAFGMVQVNFAFSATSALDTAGDYRILPLSVMDVSSVAGHTPIGLLKREFPHQVRIPGEATLHIEAKLPDDWKVTKQHPAITSKQAWGETLITSGVKDGRFTFTRSIKLTERFVPADGWNELRHWLLGAGARPDNAVVFNTKSSESAKK
jgi:hypothetical protein